MLGAPIKEKMDNGMQFTLCEINKINDCFLLKICKI